MSNKDSVSTFFVLVTVPSALPVSSHLSPTNHPMVWVLHPFCRSRSGVSQVQAVLQSHVISECYTVSLWLSEVP